MCEDLGLAIYLFQPFRDFDGVSAERLAKNVERAKRKFELMHELGTDRILVCSNVSSDTIRDDALIVDQFGTLAGIAKEAGVIVAYEAFTWGRYVNSYKHAWKLIDAVNHPSLGLALDTFHTLSIRDSVDEIAAIPGDRIAFVQIADAPVLAMDVLEWSRYYRCFSGRASLMLRASRHACSRRRPAGRCRAPRVVRSPRGRKYRGRDTADAGSESASAINEPAR